MFRINNEQVIDATLTGGPARYVLMWYWLSYLQSDYVLNWLSFLHPSYVNHSCAPNCVAEVVTFDKEDKIIIISSRRIPKGEEVQCIKKNPHSLPYVSKCLLSKLYSFLIPADLRLPV